MKKSPSVILTLVMALSALVPFGLAFAADTPGEMPLKAEFRSETELPDAVPSVDITPKETCVSIGMDRTLHEGTLVRLGYYGAEDKFKTAEFLCPEGAQLFELAVHETWHPEKRISVEFVYSGLEWYADYAADEMEPASGYTELVQSCTVKDGTVTEEFILSAPETDFGFVELGFDRNGYGWHTVRAMAGGVPYKFMVVGNDPASVTDAEMSGAETGYLSESAGDDLTTCRRLAERFPLGFLKKKKNYAEQTLVVQKDVAPLRQTASNRGPVTEYYDAGTEMTLLEAEGNFYYVAAQDGTEGYMPRNVFAEAGTRPDLQIAENEKEQQTVAAPETETADMQLRTGKYTASENGYGGTVTVTVNVDEEKTVSFSVEAERETPGLGDKAAEMMEGMMNAAGTVEIDGVAGATFTSNAVLEAAAAAFAQATETVGTVKVGTTVTFGHYPQTAEENDKTPIEWQVLDVQDGKALLISKYGLDGKQYNERRADVTWESCTLRSWLNNEFLNDAFGAEEQARIETVTVSADKNPSYSTYPGNSTQDKVFLLSIPEAQKYFKTDEDRKCVPTAYAKAQGCYTSNNYKKDGQPTCWWWLRSPGDYQNYAASVNYVGGVIYNGYYVNFSNIAIRPALWVEIS